jgi:hypothetical protein
MAPWVIHVWPPELLLALKAPSLTLLQVLGRLGHCMTGINPPALSLGAVL